MDDKVLSLYRTLQSAGADVGTEQEFNDYFFAKGDQGYKNRLNVWQTFKDAGADVGKNYEEFRDWLGLHPADQQSPQPKPAVRTSKPAGFGQLDTTSNQFGRQGWTDNEEKNIADENIVDKTQRIIGGNATPKEQRQIQQRMQQRQDEIDYEKETGKRLRQPVLSPEWEAPTVARDEDGNILRDDNGNPLVGFSTDEGRASAHQQVMQEQEEWDALSQKEKNERMKQMRLQFEKDNYEEPTLFKTIGKKLGSGFMKFGLGTLEALQQLSSGMIVEDASSPTGYRKTDDYDTTLYDKDNHVRRGLESAQYYAERMSREAEPMEGKGFLDMLWDGEIGAFLQKGVGTAMESLPMTLSIYSWPTMVLNGISMAGNNYREQALENPDVSPWKRFSMAAGSAAIEQVVEMYADPLFKYVGGRKIFGKAAKEQAEELSKEITQKATETMAQRIFKGLGHLAKDAAGEGAEEVITNFGNDALGEALDLLNGEKDFGLRAQWEELKKKNPDANLWDFAVEKAKENVESFIGGAMAGAYTSGTTQASVAGLQYAFGGKVSAEDISNNPDARIDPVTMDVAQSFDDGYSEENADLMKQYTEDAQAKASVLPEYGQEFAKMVMSSDSPVETMDYLMQNRDLYTDEQIEAAADYFSAQARAEGVMLGAIDKIDYQVEQANAQVRANTHQATGDVVMAKVGDLDYYVVAGDIVTDPDTGMTSLVGTGGAVVVKDPITGETSVKSPQEVMVYSMQNADDLIQQNETVLREQLTKQADDDITYGSPANEVFDMEDTVALQDGQGGVIEGQIVGLPNAIDGVFVVQTNDGRALQMTANEMNRRIVGHNGVEVQRGTPAADAAGTVAEQQTLAAEPQGTVQGAGLNNAVGEQSLAQGRSEESNPQQSALSKIPVRMDADGKPLKGKNGRPILDWHKASVEDAAAALVETTGGDKVMARDTATDLVKNEQARLEKIRKQKPKGDDPIEIAESRVSIRKQEQEQQAVIKHWQDVNQLIQQQMREEQEQAVREREAAKSEEQRQREAEEARIRQEQQAAIQAERRRKQVEEEVANWNKPYGPLSRARKEMEKDADAVAILNDTEPRSLDEWVSSLLRPQSMMWEDETDPTTGRTVIGLQSELGLQKKDIERIGGLVAPSSKGGKPFGQVVHDIWEDLPEGMRNMYDDQDVRNALIGLFGEGNTMRMRHLAEEHRIEEAREMMKENERRDAEAELDAWAEFYHLTPEERETFEDWLQLPPTEPEQEVINNIIAEHAERQSNGTSPSVGEQPVSGTLPTGVEGGEGPVQGTAEATGNGVDAEAVEEGAETVSGEPSVSDDEVAGGTQGVDREALRVLFDQIGEDVTLADRMSDYEVEQLTAMIDDWEAVNSEYGQIIEEQDKNLKSKNKAVRDAAKAAIDEAQAKANETYEPIEMYLEELNTKYGIEKEEPFEGAIPTPKIDMPRYMAIRQALVEGYRSGDKDAIQAAAQQMQAYVDEGLDHEGTQTEIFDIAEEYDGNDPEMLADQYIVRTYWDRYLDDDVDQEYIKTGLKPEMRGEAAVTQQQTQQIAPSEQLKPTDLRDAVRPESAELGVNEANARARYQLSKTEKDTEGNAFYEKNGSIDLWSLPELFAKARRQAAPIRLTERNLKHILNEHGKEIGDIEKIFEFLDDIFKNAKVLRPARGRAMFVIVENDKTNKAAIIKLMPSDTGDYYNVETAGYYRKDKWKNDEDVIADLREPGQSDAAADVSKPQTPDDNGGEPINAKTQASSSGSKDTKNISNDQEKSQENAPYTSFDQLVADTDITVKDNERKAQLKAVVERIMKAGSTNRRISPRGVETRFVYWAAGLKKAERTLLKPWANNYWVEDYDDSKAKTATWVDEREQAIYFIKYTPKGVRASDIEWIIVGKQTLAAKPQGTVQPATAAEPIGKTSSPEEIAQEEAKVDTNPTEGQKEAGNYQKGHINVDGYDITIENPKDSVRSGVDSKGNRWETTMRNTYGYIRGTEGVDGDHIDVFLSDNPASGSVFVVDQVNPETGAFDEHKVMYGFASEEEAREAYLSNYSKGWQGLGAITEVSREEFAKWIKSSHRKTKPFTAYKGVKTAAQEVQQNILKQLGDLQNNGKQYEENKEEAFELVRQFASTLPEGTTSRESLRIAAEALDANRAKGGAYALPFFDGVTGNINSAENYSNIANEGAESENNELPLPNGWERLPTYDIDNEKTGDKIKGLKTLLDENYKELIKAYSSYANSDRGSLVALQQAREAIRRELDLRDRKNKEWSQVYNIKKDRQISLEDLSRLFKDNNSSEVLEKLFDKVVEVAKQIGLDIRFDDKLNAAGSSNYNGQIRYNTGLLTSSGYNDEDIARIILHELIHSVTQSTVAAQKSGGKYAAHLTDSQKEAAQKVIDVFYELKDWAEKNGFKDTYGFKSPHEMLAEMASPNFRNILKLVKTKEKKSVWEVLKDAFHGIFSLTKETDVEKRVADLLDNMIDNFSMQTFEDTKSYNEKVLWSPAKAVEQTLMGVHNISEDKLRKVIKQGGLANPSLAVIDTKGGYVHTDYGAISLIPKASLIDSKTGRNAGTFTADAWTPTYPKVDLVMDNKGWDKFFADLNDIRKNADGGQDIAGKLRVYIESYLDGRNPDAMYWWYMYDRGMTPTTERYASAYDKKLSDRVVELTGGNERATVSDLSDDAVKELVALYHENKKSKGEELKPLSERIEYTKQRINPNDDNKMRQIRLQGILDDLEKYGEIHSNINDFIFSVNSDAKRQGDVDDYTTFLNARKTVENEGDLSDFRAWLDEKNKRYGIEEKIFDGWTPNGDKKYIANTLENVSRYMKQQGLNGAMDWSSIGSWIAKVANKENTLEGIRSQRKNLGAPEAEHDAFHEKWGALLRDIADKLGKGDMWSGEQRMSDILKHKDFTGYTKREYGITLSKEDVETINTFIKEVRENFPTGYFETKFERPVMLDEFDIAVIPEGTSEDIVKALKDAGLDVRTYKKGAEGDKEDEARRKAVMDAVNSRDDILFRDGEAQLVELGAGQRKLTPRQMRERQAYAERQWRRAHEWADDTVKKLKIGDKVTIVDSIDELEGYKKFSSRKKNAKGWYDPETDSIVIVMGNHRSPTDVVKTILHEAVAHYGLRKLFGDNFNTFLKNVYNNASDDIRTEIDTLADSKYGGDKPKATEEYLARLAEDTDFERAVDSGWFQKIKHWFLNMLKNIGLADFEGELTDNELRYLLWRSYENLAEPGVYRNVFQTAKDITKQVKLNVGNYERQRARLQKTGKTDTSWMAADSTSLYQEADELIADMQENTPKNMKESLSIKDRVAFLPAKQLQYAYKKVNDMMKDEDGLDIDEHSEKVKQDWIAEHGIEGVGKAMSDDLKALMDKYGEGLLALRWELQDRINELESEDTTLHRDVDEGFGMDDVALNAYEQAVAKKSLERQEAWQDSMISLKAIQDAIAKETGKAATGAEDAYHYENRMHGRGKNQAELYEYQYYRPMLEAFNNFCKAKGLTQEQGLDYLIAKSGLERNMYYAFRDAVKEKLTEAIKNKREKLEKDYARGTIDEGEYKYQKSELERQEHEGVDDAIQQLHETLAWQRAKEDYENGSITFDEFLRRRESLMRGVVGSLYDKHVKDYSGLTETFAKELYDDAMAIRKDAGKAIDTKERQMLWSAYNKAMREAYIAAYQVAVDDVFNAEDDAAEQRTELWNAINAATKKILKHSYESGLMDRATYNKVRGMFDYYVPLRGWDEDKASDVYTYMGKENVFSPAVKKTWGRTSKAENPLAYIGNIAISTILSGERNQMKQHFLNYVQNNPTSLVSISESWYENIGSEDGRPIWVLRSADTVGKSGDELAQVVNDFNEEMMLKARDGKAIPVTGRLRLDVHATKGQKAEHVVEVQRAGHTYQLYINGNPKAAQALNGSAARAVSRISDTAFGKWLAGLNRSMAAFFTSKNPAFVVSNLSRDLNMAGASVAVNEGKEYNARFMANVIKVLAPRMGESSRWIPASKQPTGLMPSLLRKWQKGTLDTSNETERLFKEFMDEGGETGFVNMLSVDSFKEKMQNEIAQMNGSNLFGKNVKETTIGKALRLMGETFEFYNRCAEDATRFIVYMTSRQMGKTLEESIADAKDVTLNFNRKGTGAKGNAELRDLFIFVNPAIQALANMYRMLKGHPLKLGAVTTGFITAGVLMPVINQWLLNMFGDDDDKDAYWNLPPWVRKNNLVYWVPGTKYFLTIPLAQEFRVFYGVGEMISSSIMEHPHQNTGVEIIESVADLVPINPIGNGGNLIINFLPTGSQPIMQIYANTDFTGKPIWKENQGNKYDPMFTKAYASTPKWMTKISEGINSITGGDEDSRGWLDKSKPGYYLNNPAVWNHLLQGYFGGMYNTIAKTFDLVTTAAGGETPNAYQVPVVNRFVNSPWERDNNGALGEDYWEMVNDNEEFLHNVRAKKKKAAAGDEEAKKKLDKLMDSEDYKRSLVINQYKEMIDGLRKQQKEVTDNEVLSDIKASISSYKNDLMDELQAIDGGANPLDIAMKKFNESEDPGRRKVIAKRIAKEAGASKDPYGDKPKNDYQRLYQDLRTADDVYDDALLFAYQEQLRDAGDDKAQKQLSNERKQLHSNATALHGGKSDEVIMKGIRNRRNSMIERYGLKKSDAKK